MSMFKLLGAVVAIVVALASPLQAAPLTPGDLDANTDAIVQIEETMTLGTWELSMIANVPLTTVQIGIAQKALVSNFVIGPLVSAGTSLAEDRACCAGFAVVSDAGFSFPLFERLVFPALTAHTLGTFMYANGMPSFDNTGVEEAFGFLLLKPDSTGIDLARVEFRVVPEPSVLLLLGASLAGMAFLRRRAA